jgi:ammonia channel protein AmtB
LIGVLSGGVAIGTVAGTINNIGACIAIGAAAGFVSGFYLRVLHPRLNSNRAIDHLGIFGPILICSILGGAVISPAMYRAFFSLGISNNSLGAPITDSSIIPYQLIYIGVTALISSGTAVLAGLASYKFRDSETDFDADKMVSTDYGIFRARNPNEDATEEK